MNKMKFPGSAIRIIGLLVLFALVSIGCKVSETDQDESLRLRVPDTDQRVSYTNTFGEDSDYTISPLSYTDNMNGTIIDNNTLLIWQKEDDDNLYTWEAAKTYCDNLTLNNQSDWRLPTIKELVSIVSLEESDIPSVRITSFPNTKIANYWSITSYKGDSSKNFSVSFGGGQVHWIQTDPSYVRCVRGRGSIDNNFTDKGDGTVLDKSNALVWQKADDGGSQTWENALHYCEELLLGNKSDWRLPNIKELQNLVDYEKINPSIDSEYFTINGGYYWSSTVYWNDATSASYQNFSDGFQWKDNFSASYYIRCVRGGQVGSDF